jgi:hypothetical protein
MSKPGVRPAARTAVARPVASSTLRKPVSLSRQPLRNAKSTSVGIERKIPARKEECNSIDKAILIKDARPNLLQRVEEKKQIIKKAVPDNKSLAKNKIQIKGKTIPKSAFSIKFAQPPVKKLPEKAKEFVAIKVESKVFRCLNKPKLKELSVMERTDVKGYELGEKKRVDIEIAYEKIIQSLIKEDFRCVYKPRKFMISYRQTKGTLEIMHKPSVDITIHKETSITTTISLPISEAISFPSHENHTKFRKSITQLDSFPISTNEYQDLSSVSTSPMRTTQSEFQSIPSTCIPSSISSIKTTPIQTPQETAHERIISFDDFMSSISTEAPRSPEPIKRHRTSLNILTPRQSLSKVKSPLLKTSLQGLGLYNLSPKYSGTRTQTDLSGIKFEISKREERLNRRRKAAIRIQACFRSWKVRKDYIKIKKLEKELTFTRKLEELRLRLRNSWAPVKIYKALKAWRLKKKLERAQIFEKFLEHCAVMIQKCWRGYRVRKVYREDLNRKIRQRQLRIALVRGWKIRQIFKNKAIRNHIANVKDLQALTYELAISSPVSKSNDLLYKASTQLPEVISKLMSEIDYMYQSGSWVENRLITSKSISSFEVTPSPKAVDYINFTVQIERLRMPAFDEEPIRPLYKEPLELSEEAFEPKEPKVVKKFTFLKRNKERYNPRSSSVNNTKQEFGENQDRSKLSLSPSVKEDKELSKETCNISSPQQYDYDNEEPKNEVLDKKPFNFLKRRSQKMQPQKIKWNVTRRIDCWGSKTLTSRSLRKSFDRPASTDLVQDAFFQGSVHPKLKHPTSVPPRRVVYKTLEELEEIFDSIRDEFEPACEFFSSTGRLDNSTSIPQIIKSSSFISQISEYKIQKVSRDLEQKYLQLSSDEENL